MREKRLSDLKTSIDVIRMIETDTVTSDDVLVVCFDLFQMNLQFLMIAFGFAGSLNRKDQVVVLKGTWLSFVASMRKTRMPDPITHQGINAVVLVEPAQRGFNDPFVPFRAIPSKPGKPDPACKLLPCAFIRKKSLFTAYITRTEIHKPGHGHCSVKPVGGRTGNRKINRAKKRILSLNRTMRPA